MTQRRPQIQTGPLIQTGPFAEKDAFQELNTRLGALPQEVLCESGRFLYSSIDTLDKGDYYFLGYNPGGAPEKHLKTLRDEIKDWQFYPKGWNAYCDEKWSTELQDRVKILFGLIAKPSENGGEAALRRTCASNLIFTRSSGKKSLPHSIKENAKDVFWPIHQEILNIVKPRCIIVYDKDAYDIFRKRLGNPHEDTHPIEASHAYVKKSCLRIVNGGFSSEVRLDHEVKLIYIPHLSYYGLEDDHATQNRIKEMFK